MHIHPRLTGHVMSFIITIGMSLVMSFTMTAINVGFAEYFLYAWLRSWLVGLLVGFPTAAVIVPLAQKVVIRQDGEVIKLKNR
ncbi:MAG: DUF2798 domain-containing protein [Desulfobacterales bacterium]